jgi:hypothetical protein
MRLEPLNKLNYGEISNSLVYFFMDKLYNQNRLGSWTAKREMSKFRRQK